MKKLFLVLLLVLGLVGYVYADTLVTSATKARAAALDKGIQQVVAVGDVSDGYSAEVSSAGALSVMEYPKTVAASTGGTLNTGTALVGSACRVYSITCSGFSTAAGGYVLIYDAAAASGTPVFECTAGTAKETVNISVPGGAIFSTGVFADSNTDNSHISITYED
jgi:hypothetical protein